MMQNLLEKRKEIKKKKPNFVRQDAHKKVRLSNSWRKCRGSDSKMRLNRRGYSKSISKGYKSPRLVRGLDRTGLKKIIINCPKDLLSLNIQTDGALIASTVSKKKRIDIAKKAIELKITILNLKDPENFVKEIEEKLKKKIEEKKEKEQEKAVKKKEQEKKNKEEEKNKEKTIDSLAEVDIEEKKEKEIKEQNKILTKKK